VRFMRSSLVKLPSRSLAAGLRLRRCVAVIPASFAMVLIVDWLRLNCFAIGPMGEVALPQDLYDLEALFGRKRWFVAHESRFLISNLCTRVVLEDVCDSTSSEDPVRGCRRGARARAKRSSRFAYRTPHKPPEGGPRPYFRAGRGPRAAHPSDLFVHLGTRLIDHDS
jgi:hypothetical protein